LLAARSKEQGQKNIVKGKLEFIQLFFLLKMIVYARNKGSWTLKYLEGGVNPQNQNFVFFSKSLYLVETTVAGAENVWGAS
jgi:hypothetical protein